MTFWTTVTDFSWNGVGWIILFYVIIALLVYINRKKFEVQAKFIFLYKTQFGIKFIDKFAEKFKEWIRIFGYVAMGIGFLGMILISIVILQGVYNLLFVPSAPPTLSPFIPGVPIPGSPIGAPPFFESIIALFIVVVIHEFSHGIVAKMYGIKIKNTGFVLFGPLPGAFVDPDEKVLDKKNDVVKHSIFAAGPFSNILTGLIIFAIFALFFVHYQGDAMDVWYPKGMTTPNGVEFGSVVNDTPAQMYGIKEGVVYTQLNGINVTNSVDFVNLFYRIKPGENVSITAQDGTTVWFIASKNPQDEHLGYLGVMNIQTKFALNHTTGVYVAVFNVFTWIGKLLFWIFLISIGLGLANLLPVGPVDGGRMLYTALENAMGKEKSQKIFGKLTVIGIVVILLLLLVPIFKSVLGI